MTYNVIALEEFLRRPGRSPDILRKTLTFMLQRTADLKVLKSYFPGLLEPR